MASQGFRGVQRALEGPYVESQKSTNVQHSRLTIITEVNAYYTREENIKGISTKGLKFNSPKANPKDLF